MRKCFILFIFFGDMFDFYDFLSNKSSDDVIKELYKIVDSIDGIGNKK